MILLVNNRCNRIEVFLRVSLRIFQINEKMHQGMTKIINVKRQFLFFSFSRTFPRCASYSTKYSHQSAVGSLMKQDMQNLPVRFLLQSLTGNLTNEIFRTFTVLQTNFLFHRKHGILSKTRTKFVQISSSFRQITIKFSMHKIIISLQLARGCKSLLEKKQTKVTFEI